MRKVALLLLTASTAAGASEPPGLPRSTPEAQGVSSSAILAFVEAAEKDVDALHSLMVVRHGQVVAEGWWGPYRRDDPHVLFSLTKSFSSTGIGLAVAEGKLSLDDMLSEIVQKATGTKLRDYLGPRLFEPLGIRNPKWDETPRGVSLGGYGLSVTTEDIARFAQLYLQKGEWGGKRLLPAEWVAAATTRQASNGSNPASDWDQGYGYQLALPPRLLSRRRSLRPVRHRHAGAGRGHRDHERRAGHAGGHEPCLGEHPSRNEGGAATSGRSGARASPEEARRSLAAAAGGTPDLAGGPPGRGRPVRPSKNEDGIEAIGLAAGPEPALVIRSGGHDRRVPVGSGEWRRGGTFLVGEAEQPVAATGAWTADDTFTARVCRYETPFCATLGLWFTGRALVLDQETNVAFGPTKRPQLVGRPRGLPGPAPASALAPR